MNFKKCILCGILSLVIVVSPTIASAYGNTVGSSEAEKPALSSTIPDNEPEQDDINSKPEELDYDSYRENLMSSSATTIEDGACYVLKNAKSGKYVDIDNGSKNEGANALQYYFHGADNQVWKLHYVGYGYYSFAPQHAPDMRLTVLSSNGNEQKGNVGIRSYERGDAAQEWKIVKNSRGNYIIQSHCSNEQKVLTVENGSNDNGVNIFQYTYSDNDYWTNDEWVLEPFIHLRLEYDQGYKTISEYSDSTIQSNLVDYGEIVATAFYDEFGIKMKISSGGPFTSLQDECGTDVTDTCHHGSASSCTNTYLNSADYIHHKNFSKFLNWNVAHNRWANAINVRYSGHAKCAITSDGHIKANIDKKYYAFSFVEQPYVVVSRSPSAGEVRNALVVMHEVSHCFGTGDDPNANSPYKYEHDRDCIMNLGRTDDINFYNRVQSGDLPSYWCEKCIRIINGNLTLHSNG